MNQSLNSIIVHITLFDTTSKLKIIYITFYHHIIRACNLLVKGISVISVRVRDLFDANGKDMSLLENNKK